MAMSIERMILRCGFLVTLAFCLMIAVARGQETGEEKIRGFFDSAIAVMGGEAYMNVRDIVTQGQYFTFDSRGNSSGLIRFTDYTRFPDKSRFELGNRKNELEITIFDLEKNEGWIIQGEREAKAATKDEMKGFKVAVNHSLENIIRFHWQDPQNRLFYLGAGDGADVTRDMVRIITPENDDVVVYFDRVSKLPAKIEFQQINDRGVRSRIIEEYSQWHKNQDILMPMRSDRYTNGRRSSQMYILKVSYNGNVSDDLFSQPVSKKKK